MPFPKPFSRQRVQFAGVDIHLHRSLQRNMQKATANLEDALMQAAACCCIASQDHHCLDPTIPDCDFAIRQPTDNTTTTTEENFLLLTAILN